MHTFLAAQQCHCTLVGTHFLFHREQEAESARVAGYIRSLCTGERSLTPVLTKLDVQYNALM